MGWRDLFTQALTPSHAGPTAEFQGGPVQAANFKGLDDPLLRELLTGGMDTHSGAKVNVESALRIPAMFRAVSLISGSIGMLPIHLIDEETKQPAKDHPLYRILHRQPNNWQTSLDFRVLMQLRALTSTRPSTALIVRSRQIRTGRDEIIRLIPLNPDLVEAVQRPDWSVVYKYQAPDGGLRTYAPEEIFHLRGMTLDGINGISLVKQARDAIGLAISAEIAAGRLFRNGSMIDGYLKATGQLGDVAFERLKKDWQDRYAGVENAGKTPLLEEGTEYVSVGQTARDAELALLRKMQVEEIARVTGVPRPLLMVDETSWGSGIQALGQFFVQYALNFWFEAWQQAAERSLLLDSEKDRYAVKFNPAALLRGSVKEQGEFFAKAMGAGGQPGWMTANEVRDLNDMPRLDGGDTLNPGTGVALEKPEEEKDEPEARR